MKIDKRKEAGNVNSSYTVFFMFAAIGVAFIFSDSFSKLQYKAWPVILAYALLVYFIWDFIKQLYSPAHSLIVYGVMFIILPFVISSTTHLPIALAGTLVWFGAMTVAGIAELLYELIFRSVMPTRVTRRLLVVDNTIDKSMMSINIRQLSLFNYRGLAFAIGLMAIYYVATYLLLKP